MTDDVLREEFDALESSVRQRETLARIAALQASCQHERTITKRSTMDRSGPIAMTMCLNCGAEVKR